MNVVSIRRNVLNDFDCYATTAIAIAVDEHGIDCVNWLPEVLVQTMEKTYGELPDTTIDKLLAAQSLVTTDFYYHKPEIFVRINNILFNGSPDDEVMDLPELCWGVMEAQLLFPHSIPNSPLELISSDVYGSVLEVIRQAGILKTPESLRLLGININKRDSVSSEFIDSPKFYHVIQQFDEDRVETINIIILEKLRELMIQLAQVGLGVAEDNIKKMLLAKVV